MAEITLEERLISGTGVLRVPPTEAAMRYVSLLLDVIREPSFADYSKRYNPNRQRYATCVFLRKGYVVDEQPLDYAKRRFDYVIDPTGQLLVALKCANKQIQGKLGGASSNIASFSNLNLLWDEVRIVCHLDTAVQARLRMDILDDCGDDYSEKSPPPPPAPLPKVPKGTSIGDISPPYEDDDDVTSKDPLDSYVPPPPVDPPRTCITRTVVIRVYESTGSFTLTNPVFGDVGVVEVFNGGRAVGVYSYGVPWSGSGTCSPTYIRTTWVAGTEAGKYINAEIVSITPPQ